MYINKFAVIWPMLIYFTMYMYMYNLSLEAINQSSLSFHSYCKNVISNSTNAILIKKKKKLLLCKLPEKSYHKYIYHLIKKIM